jgi:hypothetical protein
MIVLLHIHGSQQHLPPINRYKSRNRVLVAAQSRLPISSHVPVPTFQKAFSSEAKPTGKCPGKELKSFADGQATRLLSQRATVFKPATTRSLVAESAHH